MSSRAVEAAAETLYAGSLRQFTSARKRLADELKAEGDKQAAGAVAKLARPSVSAWAVNRLWRDARVEFDALLATGERLRRGDFAAGNDQRQALARLRGRAEEILESDGHAPSVGTLNRIATTLQALSAAGSFDPDPPGRLVADRDPPGFEVLTGAAPARRPADKSPAGKAAGKRAPAKSEARDPARERQDRAQAAARERLERTAERYRRTAEVHARVVDELRDKLRAAEADLKEVQAKVAAAEKQLAATTTRAAKR